jgi:hypothetical protein
MAIHMCVEDFFGAVLKSPAAFTSKCDQLDDLRYRLKFRMRYA